MWAWLKKLFQNTTREKDERKTLIKDFDNIAADLPEHDFQHQGIQSIPTDKIVGSVGRARELDHQFRYRKRAITDRYYSIQEAARQGKPQEPIKVVRIKRDRTNSEYYVIDGHHRVADAKRKNYDEMNADVTDLVIKTDDPDEK